MTLEKIIEAFKPTVLIGTTGQPGIFTPAVLRSMAAVCERPIIFPLSNPTSKADCTPADALLHSDGRAIVAAGSPFEPVTFAGRTHTIGQCNNAFVFPGVGLGALVSNARHVPDSFFRAAAHTLAEFTTAQSGWNGALYPGMGRLRELSRAIAFKVAQTARAEGSGRKLDDEALAAAIEKFTWFPEYPVQARAGRK
jgi:malate dehydrogenase (oxaloacetate-decarboxylating)